MVIDVITERNQFVFWRFLGNGKEFSSEIFALRSENFFRIFYNKISTNHSPPLNMQYCFA